MSYLEPPLGYMDDEVPTHDDYDDWYFEEADRWDEEDE